jgi:anti-sigma regulatory factor (Ser/Thr protein kinase)
MQQTALRTHLELAAMPTAVPCARGHVRSIAREWGLDALADAAELIASELVTNAVLESERLKLRADLATVPIVRIWVISDGTTLVIHVWDSSTAEPVRRDAGPGEEGGRGLLLVETLSKDWGTYQKLDGKVVWAMVADTIL